ncbi:MAG: tRNA threonylcarbamoyladenosine dehydratase [Lachnospiraceae bacterium]|nr:tRNA threonylcarbamoyladenosine dehydratase [Lachnospiraceae bacterium]
MPEQFSRTELLIGKEGLERLQSARVAVFGIGGVGGYAVEALARSGVGSLVLIDDDRVCLSNINRQIIATHKTLGQYKVDVMKERVLDINPQARVEVHRCFFLPENADEFDFSQYSYVVDAVDTVTAKLEIIVRAQKSGVPVISCMGAGNKLDPTGFQVADLYETTGCPLARVMRRECRKRGVERLKVVYSTEKPVQPMEKGSGSGTDGVDTSKNTDSVDTLENTNSVDASENTDRVAADTARRSIPGSVAFVPSAAGLILAGEVIRDLAGV